MNSKNVLSWKLFLEELKQPDDMVNLFKISTNIDGEIFSSWAVSQSLDERTILPFIISAAKSKMKDPRYQGSIGKLQNSNEGYLYQYIQGLITRYKTPGISARELTDKVSSHFLPVEKVTNDRITRRSAEELKNRLFKQDPNSFKLKGTTITAGPASRDAKQPSDQEKELWRSYTGGSRLKEESISKLKTEYIDTDNIQFFNKDLILFNPRYIREISELLEDLHHFYIKGPLAGRIIPQSDIDKYNLSLLPKAAMQLISIYDDDRRKNQDKSSTRWGLRSIYRDKDPLLFLTLEYVFRKYNITPDYV